MTTATETATTPQTDWHFGSLMRWHVLGTDSGGQLTMVETLVRAGGEPPLHVHAREDEAFFVIEGEMLFQRGMERITAKAGDAVFLPRGIPHGFAVRTETARMILVFTPAGLEGAFRSLSIPAEYPALPPAPDGPPDAAAVEAAARAFGERGVTFVGPPLPVLLANE